MGGIPVSLQVLMGIQRDCADNPISILPDIQFKETVTSIFIIIMASSPAPRPGTSQSMFLLSAVRGGLV